MQEAASTNRAVSICPLKSPWSSRYRWVMLALLWLIYTTFGIITRSLYPLVTPILADLRMSYSQMGLVMGSWQLTYIAAAAVVGVVIDRWGIRRALFFGSAVMALSSGLRYFSHGFYTFLPVVALFGIGGPMISVGSPKTIAQWFRGKDRGTAVGIYLTGPWIGGAFALSATNRWIMPLSGDSWRMTFALYGMLTLAVAILWWVFARDLKPEESQEAMGMRRVFTALIRVRNVQIVLASGVLALGIIHGLTSWLPKILEGKGFSPTVAGYAASLPLLGGIPSLLILPRIIPAAKRGLALGVFALLAAASALSLFTLSGAPLYCGLVLYGVASSALIPLLTLILMETPEVGQKHMGSAGGLFFCVSEIGGFLSPVVVGTLVDWTGGFLAGGFFVVALGVTIFLLSPLVQNPRQTPLRSPDR
jgi:MFS transporter, CP family, cyanate transporter